MTLPRLCSEGVKALGRLAQRSGNQARQSFVPASLLQGRAYSAEPVPAEGAYCDKLIVTSTRPTMYMDFPAVRVTFTQHSYFMGTLSCSTHLRRAFADEPPITSGGSSGDPADTHLEMKGIRLRGAPMYLDMQATTPLDPRVLDAMLPYLTEQYGNPHSRTHMYGWESEDAVEVARKQVLQYLHPFAQM
jgi:hypothetical protein